ncbi:type II toxin-antitoxin system HicB family antitoxin [Sphingomonas psychrolutea]|uniref:HicB family protein n=1 Tax=Sphingomonas psychrolutea TaxID=1259676 RepID=A0ABQ1H261_9SPHN|nr:type II toxin-antitoxin system HicB family antitoxin [Sphingomonas psychrolutea]GGA55215.1 HicB family protein [Sphingomonas psychrolutea]
MTAVYYPAIIERGPHGYGVFFPDLPGCVSAGDTLQDAARNAEEALDLHLSGLAEDGIAFPVPGDLDAIPPDPDVIEAARMLVRGEQPGRSVRVQVSIDEGLLARIDRVAPNRSGFLADAARVALAARNA